MFNILFKKETPESLAQKDAAYKAKAAALGKSYGLRNLPPPGSTESLEKYLGPIVAGYRSMLAEYSKPHSAQDQGIVKLQKSTIAGKQQRLEDRLKNANIRLQQLRNEKQSLPEDRKEKKSYLWVHVFLLLAAVWDALYTRRAMSVLESNSNVVSVIIFLGLVAVFMALPYGLVWLYRTTKEHPYRFVIWTLASVVVVGAFVALAQLRVIFLHHAHLVDLQSKVESTVDVPAIFFVLIQLFLLFLGCCFCAGLPSEQEHRITAKASRMESDITEAELKVLELEAELYNLPERQLQQEISRFDTAANAASNEAKIRSMFDEARGIFVEHNLAARPDGECPEILGQSITI